MTNHFSDLGDRKNRDIYMQDPWRLFRIIAEFVETEAVRSQLRTVGIDFAQGFAIDIPRPAPGVLSRAV